MEINGFGTNHDVMSEILAMIPPLLPPDETSRQAALGRLQILDTPLEERFERITRLARKLLGVPIAAISLVDHDRQWFKSIQGLCDTQLPREQSFCGYTILSDELNVITDASLDERFQGNPLVVGEPNVSFYAGCPIHSPDGFRIGALCVIDRKPRRIGREDRQALMDLGMMVETELRETIASEVVRDLLGQLASEHRLNMIDPLTRLWNRDGLSDALQSQLQRVASEQGTTAVMMVDLDHFKKVNDQYGHLAGDEVLRQAAKRMLGSLRQHDIVGRFGGEEFVVVLHDPGSQMTALRIAQRLRERISDGPIRVSELAVPVTASVGLVFLPCGTDATIDQVLKQADDALLRAKRTGRDRLVCANESTENNVIAQAS